eukprot:11169475-Lingulodinium_polyedra.AAC.1
MWQAPNPRNRGRIVSGAKRARALPMQALAPEGVLALRPLQPCLPGPPLILHLCSGQRRALDAQDMLEKLHCTAICIS